MPTPIGTDTGSALVDSARAQARQLGKPLSIAVVDHTGFLVLLERMDGARPMSGRIAAAKAYTSVIMQRPTSILERLWTSEPVFYKQISDMADQQLIAAPGGYPLKEGGMIVGAIGISGASGEDDRRIAEGAAAAAGFPTNF